MISLEPKPKVVGLLSPGLDVCRFSPDAHDGAGTKSAWNDNDQAAFFGALNSYEQGVLTNEAVCIGGGSVGIIDYLARTGAYDVHAYTVIGEDGDPVSDIFYRQMTALPFTSHVIKKPHHVVGGCVIDLFSHGDSASRGSQRDSIEEYLDPEIGVGADIVVASGKLALLDLLYQMEEGLKLSYTPSHTETIKNPEVVRRKLDERRLFLLAVNKKEADALFGRGSIEKDALEGTQFADNVLVTGGAEGACLAQRGVKEVASCPAVKAKRIVDTTGAGECAYGATVHGLLQGWDSLDILKSAANACAEVIQYVGALGPRQPRFY